MEWFESLYDDFRQRTVFGNIPEEHARSDVDFLTSELALLPGHKVLDLFSGTGRHSIELSRRGFDVVGVELNAQYVGFANDRAKEAGVTPQFITGDVRKVPFGMSYDAAIIMWMSFGYFDDKDEIAVLDRIYSALKPGGRFALEIMNRDFLVREFIPRDEKEIDGVKVIEEREFDFLTSRVHSKITRKEENGTVQRETHWRLYSAHELKITLEDIGFSLVAAYGSLDRKPIDFETKLMRLIFEKKYE
ncbi:class I SAM-dependent methyltransferase [Candidatus Riflebacteria bacterium]